MAGTVAFMNIQPAPHTAPHQCRVPWLALMNRLWAGAAHGASGPKYRFTVIHGPNILGSYAILFFTASDFTSITCHIHNWVLFLLWLCLFILSGVISPLISSSILGTYRPGEFIFQYPIFLPFHTVHGILKARILKWFAIPFSSGPHFVRTLHHDPSILGDPTWCGSYFDWVRQDCGPCDQFG